MPSPNPLPTAYAARARAQPPLRLRLLQAWATWRRRSRDAQDLRAMDDQALADLGIGRGQIEAVLNA